MGIKKTFKPRDGYAELLRRRSNILAEALKVVNDTPAENPNLDVDKLITFLHHGK